MSTSVPFSFFCSLLRDISEADHIFRNFVYRLRREYTLPPGTTATFFRLLFPEHDVRRKYGMKDTLLAQALSDVFTVSATRLKQWDEDISTTCLGIEVREALKERHHDENVVSSLTIQQVDELLDELAAVSGYSHFSVRNTSFNRRSRTQILHSLYHSLSSGEASFLTQIILKDLYPLVYLPPAAHFTDSLLNYNAASVPTLQPLDAMTVWDPSFLMRRAMRVCATFDDAAQAFETGRLPEPCVGRMLPVPKSSKGRSASHALSFLRKSDQAWAEVKYDGERAQIHVQLRAGQPPAITIYSKTTRDSTWDRFATNIILDAEMVALKDDKIEEFWRIRPLIEATAKGARSRKRKPQSESDEVTSQCSLSSELADDHHLGLVFFDILLLDGVSQLSAPYSERRKLLESLIQLARGESMIADRFPINLRRGIQHATMELNKIFAGAKADFQEGLVIKANDSGYNQWNKPWVKLKADYIPGFGDNAELLLVGAGRDPDRAKELAVSKSVLTTFFIGSVNNARQLRQDPTIRPHIHVYFVASYGLTRAELESLNFLVKNSDKTTYQRTNKERNLDGFVFLRHDFLLHEPLCVDLFGDGFTKKEGSMNYEIRWPRIVRVHRRSERGWRHAFDLQKLNKVAHESIGRVSSVDEIEDWLKAGFGSSAASPGIRSPEQRKARFDDLLKRLDEAEGILRVRNSSPDPSAKRQRLSDCQTTGPLRSVINLVESSQSQDSNSSKSTPPRRKTPARYLPSPSISSPLKLPIVQLEPPEEMVEFDQPSITTTPLVNKKRVRPPSPPTSPISFDPTPAESETLKFLNESAVWFAPASFEPSWKAQLSEDRIMGGLRGLYQICGYLPEAARKWQKPPRLRQGVIFLDSQSEKTWEKRALMLLNEHKNVDNHGNKPKMLPLYFFDIRTFQCGSRKHVLSQALPRLTR
ncbi:hypothetical protein C8J56DRAFT_953899 [Mycena floridula]|nr:hypothetical protein C8J56DRAFT_953899 [Mycena floridula]